MAKVDVAQVLTIAAAVQSFITNVHANYTGTKAQKKAAVIKAVRQFLPLVEVITGKDLMDNAKFNTLVSAIVDVVMKAPETTAKRRRSKR